MKNDAMDRPADAPFLTMSSGMKLIFVTSEQAREIRQDYDFVPLHRYYRTALSLGLSSIEPLPGEIGYIPGVGIYIQKKEDAG